MSAPSGRPSAHNRVVAIGDGGVVFADRSHVLVEWTIAESAAALHALATVREGTDPGQLSLEDRQALARAARKLGDALRTQVDPTDLGGDR